MLAARVDRLLCFFARIGIGLLQAMPLRWAARLGRYGGEVAFRLDKRHRRMVIGNLTRCFQHEKSPAEKISIRRSAAVIFFITPPGAFGMPWMARP